MRIDLEQFLAITMMLGTAGAIGVAVYASGGDDGSAEIVDEPAGEEAAAEVAATPAPPPAPEPASPPVVQPEPEGPPPLPAEPDADFLKDPALDGVPAPHVEGFG